MRRLIPILILLLAMPAAAQSTRDSAQEEQERPRSEQRARTNGGSLMRGQLETIAGQPPEGSPRPKSDAERTDWGATQAPEPRIIRKHDLVTVIVREQSEFKSEASADLKKDEKLEAELTEFIRLQLAGIEIDPTGGSTPRFSASGNREWKGDGSLDRKDQFTTRVQAEVVDIKPNGNVVLQARTRITTDDDERLFVMSGMIRARDITPDNTVLSTQMYDLELNKQHTGTLREATRRGWLSKFLDQISPF